MDKPNFGARYVPCSFVGRDHFSCDVGLRRDGVGEALHIGAGGWVGAGKARGKETDSWPMKRTTTGNISHDTTCVYRSGNAAVDSMCTDKLRDKSGNDPLTYSTGATIGGHHCQKACSRAHI